MFRTEPRVIPQYRMEGHGTVSVRILTVLNFERYRDESPIIERYWAGVLRNAGYVIG